MTLLSGFSLRTCKIIQGQFRSFGRCHHSDYVHKCGGLTNTCRQRAPLLNSFQSVTAAWSISRSIGYEDPPKDVKLKLKDAIPTDYNLIYKTSMDNYIFGCHAFAMFSSVSVSILATFKFFNGTGLLFPEELNSGNLSGTYQDLYVFLGSLVIINLIILLTASRFPVRIYADPTASNYVAIFSDIIPYTTKQFQYKKGDLKPVPPTGVLPWKDARFRMAGKQVLLLENSFKTNADLENMMKP